MALPSSFKLRIEDLAGFAYANNDYTTTDDAALQQFLVDGCYDVIFRVIPTDELQGFLASVSGS